MSWLYNFIQQHLIDIGATVFAMLFIRFASGIVLKSFVLSLVVYGLIWGFTNHG